jgi:uncharacterized protein
MKYSDLFISVKPLIACIHLLPLPGSPRYGGSMQKIIESAIIEATIFSHFGVDGLIVENFRDNPFYPDEVPAITVASMTVVIKEILRVFSGPVGINILRNDAIAALAVAAATEVNFIRVNVHIGAAVTDQGIIQGKGHETLRMKKMLDPRILIFADAAVKHASPLGNRSLLEEVNDITNRGMADAIILTGKSTGSATNKDEIIKVKQHTHLPVIVGSGVSAENIKSYFNLADGFIVGSYFKKEGVADNAVDEVRVKQMMTNLHQLKERNT